MNLVTETKGRLDYNKKILDDLKNFLDTTNKENLSKECLQGINNDIDKFNRNIKYYEGIIKVLEDKK
ncbi:hypothetical protein PMX22_00795 [Clostridium butyricum]|uniref:hypothetical protein n=1 Tax=Clostridium butyricum TaxID=1492 RepID=UPI00232EE8D7|nr:hypothetical protein [Clostridium butyricum]MDB2158319.1 hypothetical protein [Clostridium butyricum]